MTMIKIHNLRSAAVFTLLAALASCDNPPTMADAGVDTTTQPPPTMYRQIEHFVCPGINEVLLFSEAFNTGFNATVPSFAGVPTETLNAVVGEAKTVLKALYLGACLLNGALKLSAADGVKPGGITC